LPRCGTEAELRRGAHGITAQHHQRAQKVQENGSVKDDDVEPEVSLRQPKVDMNGYDKRGSNALRFFAGIVDTNRIPALLKQGINVGIKKDKR
jgi:hypothetical protein